MVNPSLFAFLGLSFPLGKVFLSHWRSWVLSLPFLFFLTTSGGALTRN